MRKERVHRFSALFENAYFRRLFVSYAVTTALIACLCGAVLYDRAGRAAHEELERQSRSKLLGVQEHLENTYPNVFKNAFVSNLLSAVDKPGRDAFSVYYEEYGQNVYQMYHLAAHLKTIVSGRPEAENVTVYFKNTNFMVDKHAFFPMEEHTPGAELIQRLQKDEIPTNRWLQRNVYYGEGVYDRLMTFVYSFPERAKGGEIQGYMLIDIRADRFRDILSGLAGDSGEKFVMLSVKDGYMTGSDHVTETDFTRVLNARERGAGSSDKGVSLLPASEGNGDWAYASIRPKGMVAPASAQMQRNVVFVCLGVIALGVLIAYYLSLKSYKPVQTMLLRLKERDNGLLPNQQRNEFLALDLVLNGLYSTIQQLSQQVDGNMLHALLNGRLSEDEMPKQVPVKAGYVVAAVRMENGGARELVPALQSGSPIAQLVAEKDAHEITILYFSDETGTLRERIREELERLLPSLAGDRGYAAGMGGLVQTREDIAKSNEQAASALKYTFLLGMNRVFDSEELGLRCDIPQIDYEPFERALRAGNSEAAKQFIADFSEKIKGRPVPLETAELSLAQLTMIMSKVMIDINTKERIFPDVLPYQRASQGTFAETVASICEQSMQIAGHIGRHLLPHAQHEVIAGLMRYMDAHLHEDISLDQLAGMAGLSTQYLSRQFKEIAGVSFIEYLTNVRMERAGGLLQNSRSSVTEIASAVGYSNAQYFCARFKSKFGVTPMQYRNLFKAEGDRTAHAGRR
ncbi:MAG: hypothetical protein K0Q94_3098 [Paenibacillus sp.]|nr:hypothetical protein [Paenibacillus sp.]